MKYRWRMTACLALALCGCAAGPNTQTEPDVSRTEAESKIATAQTETSENGTETDSEPEDQVAESSQETLQVDDILADGDSYLGKQISVEGQTPQSMIGDENGIPIGFYYQIGKPGDQDHRIRIEIPEDTPGMSLVTVFGTMDKDQSGYILRTTQTEAVHQTCDDVGHCTKYEE